MDRFPIDVYWWPGKTPMDYDYYDHRVLPDEAALNEALAAGWHTTTPEAKAAGESRRTAQAAGAESADDAPPTRAEMEQKAAQLGIKVDARWGDKRLSDEIAKKV